MKPKTKRQYQVIQSSEQLSNVKNKMLAWAKVVCLDHKGYATKSRVGCLDCGNTFPPELVSRKRAVCPHCNTKIIVEQSRKRKYEQRTYVAIAEICDDFQVIRNFELISHHNIDKPARYCISEVLQHWILPDGKREVVARKHTLNWYCDSWNGSMEIRKYYPKYYETDNRYDIYPQKFHPDSEFKAEYREYGIDDRLQGLTFLEAIKLLPENTKAETLLKAKQYNLAGYCYNNRGRVDRYWPSIKICMRNKYAVKDASIYTDYLDLLSYFQKDLHNAHYVCPPNLKRAHDLLVEKKRKIQERQDAERKRLKKLKDEEKFKQLKSKFFGIRFSDGTIKVKVLESIEEYMKEGDVLHHCVFTNEYYLKKDSLILSAAVGNKKTETIEVSLKTLKVIQCRGSLNKNTEYHDRILKLVNKNINLIREKLTA